MPDSEITLPPRYSQRLLVDGNSARQLVQAGTSARLEKDGEQWVATTSAGVRYPRYQHGKAPSGSVAVEMSREAFEMLPEIETEGMELRWVNSEKISAPGAVLASLNGSFRLRTEDPHLGTPGLRVPQAGALHAVLAHWSTGTVEPATIVLPTGTGKTDCMVAVVASERLKRVLVLVPSDRLRAQIAEAFESYGVLPEIGVLNSPAAGLIVGRIEHGFKNAASMRSFVESCNILVTTPSALHASNETVVEGLIRRSTHLFVDEAHHIGATTWANVRDAFVGKPVLQFTATPYRADGQRLGGRVIYSFPLGLARELGYFQPISYVSVLALADPDRAVAEAAISRLREDLHGGLDHLIMARVARIGRARDDVLPIYEELASDLSPQILHSAIPKAEQTAALEAIRARRSRIVICVDMLGEGFDFPELKIAALHDPHRSLGVALQFIGRFARSREDLGTATAVVARPDPGYDERLRALYAERSQWDKVIEVLAGQAVQEVRELDDFESGFDVGSDETLSVHVLRPKMSTVVYRTSCDEWKPERLAERFKPERIVSPPSVNADEEVAWMVVEARSAVRWAHLQSLEDVAYHLHILYWDRSRALLYINTSQLESLHEDLAEAVCGSDVQRVEGEVVYRVLGELQRPTPTNVGVIDVRNRSRRFSMHVGADVYEGFPDAERQSKSNTNIFVVAYEEGRPADRASRPLQVLEQAHSGCARGGSVCGLRAGAAKRASPPEHRCYDRQSRTARAQAPKARYVWPHGWSGRRSAHVSGTSPHSATRAEDLDCSTWPEQGARRQSPPAATRCGRRLRRRGRLRRIRRLVQRIGRKVAVPCLRWTTTLCLAAVSSCRQPGGIGRLSGRRWRTTGRGMMPGQNPCI